MKPLKKSFFGVQVIIYQCPIFIPNIGRVPKKVKNETIQVYSYPLIIPFRKWIRLLIHFLIDGYIMVYSYPFNYPLIILSINIQVFPIQEMDGFCRGTSGAPSAPLSPRAGSAGRANRWEQRGSRFASERAR